VNIAVEFGETVEGWFDDTRDAVVGFLWLNGPEVGTEHHRTEVHCTSAPTPLILGHAYYPVILPPYLDLSP
jgi:hypothetical protein